jgi:prepilin-type N-terminal cleavage/methylation domain-containing protein
MTTPRKAGFTLIELSIVLVIIGLLVGGILSGRDLIKAAEIRSAASQLQQIETAYRTFQTKYNCIMGDCPNATDYFGAGYITTGCTMPNGDGNGNGNGVIDSGGTANWTCEGLQAIKSLALANLLPTSLTSPCPNSVFFKGISDSCAYFYNDDLYAQVTATKLNTITWAGNANAYVGGAAWAAPSLSPVQARLIDEKIDDGKPTTGKFKGLDTTTTIAGTSSFVTNSCSTSGVYNQNENYTCRALYYFK